MAMIRRYGLRWVSGELQGMFETMYDDLQEAQVGRLMWQGKVGPLVQVDVVPVWQQAQPTPPDKD